LLDNAGCAFALSRWERAGVRVLTGLEKPLTLTLSRWERGKQGSSKQHDSLLVLAWLRQLYTALDAEDRPTALTGLQAARTGLQAVAK
jgi:hypothetical protein